MFKIQRTLVATALTLLGTAAAQAQMIGTYSGTTSEGGSFSLSVGDDGNGGFEFTGDSVQWTMNCATGDQQSTWWGIGAGTEIVDGKVTSSVESSYLFEKASFKFSKDGQTVTGTFQGDEPMYVDVSTSKKVEECTGDKMTVTGTLNATSSASAKLQFQNLKMKHAD